MPIFTSSAPSFRPPKAVEFSWDTFRGGLNLLLRENELQANELAQADNIILKGKGIPTKRWGTSLYNQAGNMTGSVRGLRGMYYSTGTIQLLSITDDGFLTFKNGASYTRVTGASWASGNNVYMTQLENTMYIVNGQRELIKYSMPTLVGFPTIAIPSGLGASNISNGTGSTTKAYRVSAVSSVGETLASTEISLPTQPQELGTPGGTIRLAWSAVSAATGVLQGYNIYGRDPGNGRFLGSVGASATTFLDDGSATPTEFTFPPTADSTGGPKAKYIKRFQDRLIFAGLSGEPSKVLISGRAPNHEKFDLSNGGNFIEIEPDAGDDITQIEIFRDRIIVFKERSIWQVTLTFEQIGNFYVTNPTLQLISASHGCIAPRSVVAVENDLYFLSRKGVNSLGYEANFAQDLLRSNEISIKVRPFFDDLTISQKKTAVATYFDFKYIIAFPGTNQLLVLDRERLAWLGPWSFDASVFETFYDSNGDQHLLYGNDGSANVDETSSSFSSDKGVAIETALKTKQEDFGDWSLFKAIQDVFTQFRNVMGTVSIDIRIELRSGQVITAKSFTVTASETSNSGWGADLWGTAIWGTSNGRTGAVDSQQLIRWANLHRTGRTMQILVRTSNVNDNYELLGFRGNVFFIGTGLRPANWRVVWLGFLLPATLGILQQAMIGGMA